ncbi:hypothetical protein GCM10017044_10000 [Kordiimonas sediminis]|uniref:Uncharacterized protein n=1 Tax=Kordiimonas sediminis TaxID=1735581 RepID=A0A919ANE1_9PROT|nr:hypothetical protein [Kordiimonas sediminis]GHF17600.1 hypothetical protein GCM10017044_10000 [Kordiimonas sediminis]
MGEILGVLLVIVGLVAINTHLEHRRFRKLFTDEFLRLSKKVGD